MSDDFLWNCALDFNSGTDTTWIVPDDTQLTASNFKDFSCSVRVEPFLKIPFELKVNEIRDFGIFDTIGGEVWEAAYLLCAFVLLNPQLGFLKSNVLEIGSGIGLPGLLLGELKRRGVGNCGDITLTDNDSDVLRNLQTSISNQFSNSISGLINFNVNAKFLDWNCISTEQGCNFDMLNFINNEIIMGSALCYAPSHRVLADVIKYLIERKCEEVVIIQIGDRAGFSEFLLRLRTLQVVYSLEEVSREVYEAAQRLVCDVSGSERTVSFPPDLVADFLSGTQSQGAVSERLCPFLRTERSCFSLLRISSSQQQECFM